MLKNSKFHLMAISGMILAATLVFYVSGRLDPQAPPPEPVVVSPYKIIVDEASWGLNCSKEISRQIEELTAKAKSATGEDYEKLSAEIEALKPLPQRNNALKVIQNLCGGKTICDLSFSPQSIPFEPVNYCRHELTITYLCHKYDTFHDIHLAHGEVTTIDCTDPKAETPKASQAE